MIKIGLFLLMFLLVIAVITNSSENLLSVPIFAKVTAIENHIDQPAVNKIKSLIPTTLYNTDLSRAILFVLMFIAAHICSYVGNRLRFKAEHMEEKKKYEEWRKQINAAWPQEQLLEIDNKFESLSASKPSDRQKMLKEFAILRSKLDNMGQQLAFLAIDVVNSTGMKRDEDKHLVSYDFVCYNQLIEETLKEKGVIKYAMTPDGIMSCFRTVDDAVNAAVFILEKLKEFNQNVKQIKQDFQIRCGINAGFVYIDDTTPLEQVSDRVIDIAGHMQKYAKPDTINIAASAIEPLKNRDKFNETTDVIDEQRVYVWSKS